MHDMVKRSCGLELVTNSICKQPEISKSHSARKRPAKVLERPVMPASKSSATCKLQSTDAAVAPKAVAVNLK